MTEPTPKSPEMEKLLEGFSGRTTAIEADKCIDPPIGCGGPATEFKDDRSRDEYRSSGWCQDCQDAVYGN